MKRIYIIILAIFACATLGYSQINVVYNSNTTAENMQLKKSGFCRLMHDSVYTLSVRDAFSPNMIDINLGHDVASAQNSLSQLVEWMNSAKNKDNIVIEQGSERLTVYKATSIFYILSTGNAQYCESLVRTATLASLVSATYVLGVLNANEKASVIRKSDLKRILKSM